MAPVSTSVRPALWMAETVRTQGSRRISRGSGPQSVENFAGSSPSAPQADPSYNRTAAGRGERRGERGIGTGAPGERARAWCSRSTRSAEPNAAGYRRTTSRPRSRSSGRCSSRATPSAPPPRPGSRRPTSTSRRTPTSTTRSWRSTASGEPVDPVTVSDELRRADLLDFVGGRAGAAAPPGRHAGVRERGPLRQDRQRARAVAAAHRGRRRHRGDGLRRLRPR